MEEKINPTPVTNTHHVCPECGGVAKNSGVCTTEGCHLQGSQLEACSCEDGKHSIVLNENA